MAIKDYSTTPASNTSLFPENMNPSAVNDGMRQVQADIKSFYDDPVWTDRGDAPTYASATTFTITGDVTGVYHVNRRLKLTGTTPFEVYATITASSYSAPNTTVTVSIDSGSMDATLNAVAVSIIETANKPVTIGGLGGVDVADLNDGTDGELITWDASGEATTVAAGTSGQVLTSNGAGAAPTFQDAAGGNTPAFQAAFFSNISSATSSQVVPFRTNDGSLSHCFDSDSDYNNTTYRFVPSVAGTYMFCATLSVETVANANIEVYIRKNGTEAFSLEMRGVASGSSPTLTLSFNGMLEMNGSTDYVDVYVDNISGSSYSLNGNTKNRFSGFKVY